MTKQTVGILNPGKMGVVVAKTMRNSGHEVIWASDNRSQASVARATEAGLSDVKTLQALCAKADVLVSVCPPHAAETIAESVIAQGFQGIYLDANAISPVKAKRIGDTLSASGITFIDGGIIGLPPETRNTSWLYVSGKTADFAPSLFTAGPLECEVIGTEIGKASALKMCFAAQTKGTAALLTAVLGAAENLGVRDALEKQWSRHGSDQSTRTQQTVTRVAANKAWRFAGEMDEIAETFDLAGLPDGFHLAAADIYRRVADVRDIDNATIDDVLDKLQQIT